MHFWKARFFEALDITGKNKQARQEALLLHYAGPLVFKFNTTIGEEGEDLNNALAKLDGYFASHTNTEFERFNFRLIKTEKFDQFVTRLRVQSSSCDFHDADGEIKSQITCGCYSAELRRRCLREGMEFKEVMALGRSFEVSRNQAFEIEQSITMNNGGVVLGVIQIINNLEDDAHHAVTVDQLNSRFRVY